jgi:5-formyltetrahydrofolate cyclo-ligase
MSQQAMKQSLRQSIIAARQKLMAAERTHFSQVISKYIRQLDSYRQAQTVLAYMSFGAEFETEAWVRQALQDGKQVWLPRVNSSTKQLDLYHIRDLQLDLAPGKWEIPEPRVDRCDRMEGLGEIDFILLPGVAFARDGSRLGYGGGFYDKLLERIEKVGSDNPPSLVAAAFSMQLVEDIPQEATDRKVEWLLTENEVIKCSANI